MEVHEARSRGSALSSPAGGRLGGGALRRTGGERWHLLPADRSAEEGLGLVTKSWSYSTADLEAAAMDS